jgi:hypothetical protein
MDSTLAHRAETLNLTRRTHRERRGRARRTDL